MRQAPAAIMRLAKSFGKNIIAIRRDIHSYPELGFQEKRTSAKAAEILREIGLTKIVSGVAGTGVVALMEGKIRRGARTVALRADMDALPIQELNQTPYKSRHPGVMHACGHDAHVAMLLGAAMILKKIGSDLPGNVKLIFQPAEETPATSGARALVRAGVMRNPAVDAVFCLHVNTEHPFGSIALRSGPVLAAADLFSITISGKGGHGAHPEQCVDPIMIAHQIYGALQGIERNMAGSDVRIISVCSMHAGTAFNIVPPHAELKGTVRTFECGVQSRIIERMRELVAGIAAAHGAVGRLDYIKGVPATHNDSAMTELVRTAADSMGVPLSERAISMGSEDFAFYQQHAPGVFIDLGLRKNNKQPGLHHPRFDFDDHVLPVGSAVLAATAIRALQQLARQR